MGSEATSCVDDLGFDDQGVTRDQPAYSWTLKFTDRQTYLQAVKNLRRTWSSHGLTVNNIRAPADGTPGAHHPGIRTTSDGITLTLAPDCRWSGQWTGASCPRTSTWRPRRTSL